MNLTTIITSNWNHDTYTVWTSEVTTGLSLRHGISVGYDRGLAERLARAIEAGKVFHNLEVKTDVNGAQYVGSTCAVLGRTLNADLRRLGY